MSVGMIDEERWSSLSLIEQMANIGSEVGRTRKWMEKGNRRIAEGAFFRGLDLIDATIKNGRNNMDSRPCLLKELCRARELFAAAFMDNDTDNLAFLDKYFGQFASAARIYKKQLHSVI